MAQIMKCRRANLKEDSSNNRSLSQGVILVTTARNLLSICMETSFCPFYPSLPTPFAVLNGFRPPNNTMQIISIATDIEIWIKRTGVQRGMSTAWVILFLPAQTRQIAMQQNFELHTLHLTPYLLFWGAAVWDSSNKGSIGCADKEKEEVVQTI